MGRSPPAPYIRRGRGGGATHQKDHPIGALAAPPSLQAAASLLHLLSPDTAWRSPVGSPPYTPRHRRRAADLASLSTNSCGIKIVESSSSCTCGSLGGVARAALGEYVSSRLGKSSCGARLANPCLDKTRTVFFEGEIRSPSCYQHLVDQILCWVYSVLYA